MAKYVSGYRAQTRSRSIRYSISFAAAVLLLAVLQVSVFGRLRPLGVVPDLMLGVTVAVAFFCGRYAGAITGIGAGFLIEAMGSVGLSILPIVYLFLGYLVGNFAQALGQKRFTVYLLYLGAAMLVRCGVTLLYTLIATSSADPLQLFLYVLLPEVATTYLCGLLIYAPMRLLCAFLERKK